MTNKTSNLVKRLQSARFADSEPDLFRQVVARLPIDWVGTRGFEYAAGRALRVDLASPILVPVAQLFKIVNLDPKIPWHWLVLLRFIAWAIEEDSRGPGAEKKWTSKKWQEMKEDLKSLKSTENKSLAAKHLKKKFPDKYGKLEVGYLRKLVKRALLTEETATSLLSMREASAETIADKINLIVAAIESEIDDEKSLKALIKYANPPGA